MKHTKVKSSHLSSVGYDPIKQVLEIRFKNGSVYQYKDVPQEHYVGLLDSDSKGDYHHANIKEFPTVQIK